MYTLYHETEDGKRTTRRYKTLPRALVAGVKIVRDDASAIVWVSNEITKVCRFSRIGDGVSISRIDPEYEYTFVPDETPL